MNAEACSECVNLLFLRLSIVRFLPDVDGVAFLRELFEVRAPNNGEAGLDEVDDGVVLDADVVEVICVGLEKLVLVHGLFLELDFAVATEDNAVIDLAEPNHLAHDEHKCSGFARLHLREQNGIAARVECGDNLQRSGDLLGENHVEA